MTTLALLKQDIADDLDKNLSDAAYAAIIASAVNAAIRHYQRTRFYFNETRDETFVTVADQKLYAKADDATIPKFIEIDQIVLMDGTEPYELCQITPKEWEMLTASGSSTGRPDSYCYFNESFGLYPIPDAAYTVRPIGHIMKDAPAADDEANNVWMIEAYELLRARCVTQIAQRRLRDAELAGMHGPVEMDELSRLNGETTSRIATGFVTPTEF